LIKQTPVATLLSESYLSHVDSKGGRFLTYPTAFIHPHPRLLHYPSTITMAYYNDPKAASLSPTNAFAAEEFSTNLLPNQSSAVYWFNGYLPQQISTNTFSEGLYSYSMMDSGKHHYNLSNNRCLTSSSSKSAVEANFFANGFGGYGQQLFDPQPRPPFPSHPIWDPSLANFPVAPAPTTVQEPNHGKQLDNLKESYAHRPRTVPSHCWGDNRAGPSTGAFDLVSIGAGSSFCRWLTSSCCRTPITRIDPAPVLQGLRGPQRGGANHMGHSVSDKTTTRTRRGDLRP
jgi:hypothetical protein